MGKGEDGFFYVISIRPHRATTTKYRSGHLVQNQCRVTTIAYSSRLEDLEVMMTIALMLGQITGSPKQVQSMPILTGRRLPTEVWGPLLCLTTRIEKDECLRENIERVTP